MIDWVDGQPYSARYGDVYFSSASGIEESRHAFLDGNRLAQRFAQLAPRAAFAIGETGFGTGLNFLCAWQLFERAARPDARLHYVSTELEPLALTDMERALALWPEVAPEASALLAQWDELAPGWQRFVFAGGRIVLTLLVGDARATLPLLDAEIDAWFLDGFAPAKNPELWTPDLMRVLSQRSRVGTTCATYSAAGAVRRALESAGFRVEKMPGFGPKRDSLRGECFAPVARSYRSPWLRYRATVAPPVDAIVIGAGLAGTAAAASLAARGVEVTLIERAARIATAASGNAQGVLYAKLSPHDTALSKLLVAGYQFTLRELVRRLPEDGDAWSRCGVLQLATDADEIARHAALGAQGWPASFLRPIASQDAARIANVAVPAGALYFERGGWVHPPALCAAFARHERVRAVTLFDALRLDPLAPGRWRVTARDGTRVDAALVVIATGDDAKAFPQSAHLPTHVIRGQLTCLPAGGSGTGLTSVLCGEGYVAPARGGFHCLGATFGIRDAGIDVRAEDNQRNFDLLRALSPQLWQAFARALGDPRQLPGRAALRCVAPDYLPIAGPLSDSVGFARRYALLANDATTLFEGEAPWQAGLFVSVAHGSRGLLTAPLAGELIAAQALGEPVPMPDAVADALSPSRFLARALKRKNR